ncbi:MAG: Sensor protein [uncultured bacterium]|nr:MAG: Sensor protein [uncultured bacterium]
MFKAFHLNLRSKIMFILACYILGILGMGYVSNDDLRTTEEKITILELAYSLNNIILEARRYEKNFLLYNEEEAFRENKRYLAQTTSIVEEIFAKSGKLKISPMLKELSRQVVAYQADMELLSRLKTDKSGEDALIVDRLRDQGKKMTELSEELVEFERHQIHAILALLQKQLVAWSTIAVALGIVLPLLMIYKIFHPLVIIKNATEDIAHGRFNSIEVINTRDEMQQVMEAFNTMVRELERRQDQLVQSKKLSSIGTLTAGVAHQLNNPLNNISTSCQIAMAELASADSEFLLRMLKNIDQETLRARDVVKGLLEFSRVQEFALRTAHLSDVVKRSIRLAQSQVPADIDMVVRIPEVLMFPMDTQRMQEVFINLIINAAQSIKGSGQIRITAWEDENDEVIIEVHDTGAGGFRMKSRGGCSTPFILPRKREWGPVSDSRWSTVLFKNIEAILRSRVSRARELLF